MGHRATAFPTGRRDAAAPCSRSSRFRLLASFSFGLFAALLHECDLLVTPDTSVSHLAAAWKRPAVVLFIQKDERASELWAPYHSPYRALWHPERVADIPVAPVAAALDELLALNTDRAPAPCR